MDISAINAHTVKPQFVAGNSYKGKITEVKDKPSGFTARIAFAEVSVPGYWHFNVASENETAKRIAMDELKGLTEQMGIESITDSAELLGKEVTVRLTSQGDSTFPNCSLPLADAGEPNPF
jgi:hypothetical protein